MNDKIKKIILSPGLIAPPNLPCLFGTFIGVNTIDSFLNESVGIYAIN